MPHAGLRRSAWQSLVARVDGLRAAVRDRGYSFQFEQADELLGVKSPIDVSKTARFNWRRAGDACFFFSHGIEEIQRLATFESLHVPMGKGALDGIAQENEQFDFRVVFPNPFRRRLEIKVTGCAITSDG